jgi:hypothetical protein
MNSPYFPAAPMSALIRVATVFTYALMVVIIGFGLFTGPSELVVWTLSMVVMPLGFMAIGPLFMVRGYTLERDQLRIQRLGWSSSLDLADLQEFRADPDAMKGGWRICGNGGLFCFSGYFRSKKLGNFRPFVTDPKCSVVLRTASKAFVVSPEVPERFVAALTEQFGELHADRMPT